MNAEDLKLRIMEERKSLRENLFSEWKAAQKVYETREALKRIEDTIIGEIADNGLYKNEKQRTEAKRMARINDGRYIAGLKAISDAEIERFNFQASIIDSQTRITVFTSDYEFALLGRRDAQFQFALQLAKVVQADTSIAIEVTAPKLGSNLTDKSVDGSQTANTDKNLTDLNAQHRTKSGIPDGYKMNTDLIHAFMDTQEGRMVVADWLRAHGRPVMATVLDRHAEGPEINQLQTAAQLALGGPAAILDAFPVGEPVLMTRVDDAPGKYVDDMTTAYLTEAPLSVQIMADAKAAGNDPNNPTSQGNNPAVNADLPEGVELKAGIPVCKNCGIMMTTTVAGNLTHPPFSSCASVDSSHPNAKLSRSEGAKGQRIGGVDV